MDVCWLVYCCQGAVPLCLRHGACFQPDPHGRGRHCAVQRLSSHLCSHLGIKSWREIVKSWGWTELKSANSLRFLGFRSASRDVWRCFKYPVQQEVDLHEVDSNWYDLHSRKNGRRQHYKPFRKADVTVNMVCTRTFTKMSSETQLYGFFRSAVFVSLCHRLTLEVSILGKLVWCAAFFVSYEKIRAAVNAQR